MKGRLSLLLAAVWIAVSALAATGTVANAQSGNVWQVQFYNNPYLSGQPTATISSTYAAFNWGAGAPAANMPADYWSARLTTNAYFNGGSYRFTFTADDGFTFRINNNVIFTNIDAPAPGRTYTFDVPMQAGNSFIQVDYRENTGNAYLYVNWGAGTSVNNTPTPRPPRPTAIGRLVTKYGDYTTCVRRNRHQVNCFRSDGAWNSPNVGSIWMEPKIVIWFACTPGSVLKQALYYSGPLENTQCSKTGAGYFKGTTAS